MYFLFITIKIKIRAAYSKLPTTIYTMLPGLAILQVGDFKS